MPCRGMVGTLFSGESDDDAEWSGTRDNMFFLNSKNETKPSYVLLRRGFRCIRILYTFYLLLFGSHGIVLALLK